MARVAAEAVAAQHFDVYGLRVRIEGDWREVIESLGDDFAWFRRDLAGVAGDISVTIARRPPDVGRFASVPQAFVTTRNVVFQSGSETIVDYSGQAVAVYDRASERFLVEGENEHLVHEAAYLFLLSRIGRHIDALGHMRIHALGLSGADGAVLLLLPSGGGKTTLALRAREAPGVKVLSEDTPILDRHGIVHPFPLRLGVNEHDRHLLPQDGVRRIERLEYGPKLLVSLAALGDCIEDDPQPLRHLVIGRRWLAGGGALTPVNRRALVAPLVRDGVIGLGVAQMIEYVLRQGPRDFLRQGGVVASRTACSARALASARTWRLELSRDVEQNWNALSPLLT
jgi:hypothetical protein